MKHLKTFENIKDLMGPQELMALKKITSFKIYESDSNPWISIDPYLAINYHKSMGPNDKKEGQVKIYIRNDEHQNWKKFLITSGVAKLLDTKYENNEKLRSMRIPYLPSNCHISIFTQISIIRTFIEKAYPDYPKYQLKESSEMLAIPNSFQFWDNINVGQLMDKLKEYQKEIIKAAKPYYDEWDLKQHANKFNL